jgi:hypothetical protein
VTSKPTRRAQRDPEPPEFKTRPRLRQTDSTRQQAVRNQGSVQELPEGEEEEGEGRARAQRSSGAGVGHGSGSRIRVPARRPARRYHARAIRFLLSICLFVLLLYTLRCEMRSGAGVIFGSGVVP